MIAEGSDSDSLVLPSKEDAYVLVVEGCHGPCSVTFFPKKQSKDGSDGVSDDGHLTHCSVPHLPPVSLIRIHPLLCQHQKTIILIIAIANQHCVLSTAAHIEPHPAPHMFHVTGLSHHARTSSRGHEFQSPQGLLRI